LDTTCNYRIFVLNFKTNAMPNRSSRGENLTQSPIRSLIPFARQAKEKGISVLHLNIGQPDIKTPRAALDLIANNKDEVIAYGSSEGKLSLRKKVASYYKKFDINVTSDQILVTTGASEAICFSLFSCFDEGDEIIIPEPFYANYIGFTQMSGVTIKPVSSTLEEKFDLPSTEAFFDVITEKTKAIFLCNPGNPTGRMYNKASLLRLAALVKEKDLFLIVDEVYREFCYEEEFYSVLNIDSIKNNVIVIDSISKVFSSCGARVGYIVTRNESLLHSILKYAQLRLCPPYYGQILAEACYDAVDEYLDPVRNEYNERRQYLYGRLLKMEGVKTYLPTAAFYNMVELPVDDAEAFCTWLLTDFEHKGHTVMMAPANGFYVNQELGKRQVRLAYILNKEKLALAMDCLEQALAIYSKVMNEEYSTT